LREKMAKNTAPIEKVNHVLVPKHTIISEKEKESVLNEYKISAGQLPKIFITDPAISDMNPKIGDIVKVERPSYTMKKTIVYRVVVNG
jgi:DNA-directed RNA polymerase subunit H